MSSVARPSVSMGGAPVQATELSAGLRTTESQASDFLTENALTSRASTSKSPGAGRRSGGRSVDNVYGGARSLSPSESRNWPSLGKANSSTSLDTRPLSPRYNRGAGGRRPVEKCHSDLYRDAFARQQRLRDMQKHMDVTRDREEENRRKTFESVIKNYQRLYTMKDKRSHLEREAENIERRKNKQKLVQDQLRAKEDEELRECTFRPSLEKKNARRRNRSPLSNHDGEKSEIRLQKLLDRQQAALSALEAIRAEEHRLRDHLRIVHAELHDRIQREETQRVVGMLQACEADVDHSQQDLAGICIQRVRQMVAGGTDPEIAQQQIVEELVSHSQDGVRRRVIAAFAPIRLEAEGELYSRRLAMVHELESVEAQVIALRGGKLIEEAKNLGFEFGLADKSRRSMPPVLASAMVTPTTPGAADGELLTLPVQPRSRGTTPPGSSCSVPLPTNRPLNPGTPRSHGRSDVNSTTPSRQSSGIQGSLIGSVLQPPASETLAGHSAYESSMRSSSQMSLPSPLNVNSESASDIEKIQIEVNLDPTGTRSSKGDAKLEADTLGFTTSRNRPQALDLSSLSAEAILSPTPQTPVAPESQVNSKSNPFSMAGPGPVKSPSGSISAEVNSHIGLISNSMTTASISAGRSSGLSTPRDGSRGTLTQVAAAISSVASPRAGVTSPRASALPTPTVTTPRSSTPTNNAAMQMMGSKILAPAPMMVVGGPTSPHGCSPLVQAPMSLSSPRSSPHASPPIGGFGFLTTSMPAMPAGGLAGLAMPPAVVPSPCGMVNRSIQPKAVAARW